MATDRGVVLVGGERHSPGNDDPIVVAEWLRSCYPEFAKGSREAWWLFKAITESIKGRTESFIYF